MGKLSGLTSLGCGHLTSETYFLNLKHTHIGAYTTQFVHFAHTFKKSGKAFFSRFSWLIVWSPRPERIDNVAGMRTAPRDNSAPCTVQVVCRHGALDLMPPPCPNVRNDGSTCRSIRGTGERPKVNREVVSRLTDGTHTAKITSHQSVRTEKNARIHRVAFA